MRILHIHPSLEGGGIEAMICGLANEMSKTETVSVCSIFEPKKTDVFYNKLSSSVIKLTCHKKEKGFSLKVLLDIYQIVRKGNYDIVHLHGFLYYYLLTICLFWHRRCKFFYTVHSDARRENGIWDSRLFRIKHWLFKHGIVHPITISRVSKESFTKLYRCDSKLIYNGIPRPLIDKEKRTDVIKKARLSVTTKVLLNVGRIDVPKNQAVLCRVIKRLVQEGHDVVLLIAGGITSQGCYKEISPYFSERIMYLRERNDISQLLSECDAFCLPSIWEGLPVSLLEALSVGCIPICSPVGGIVDVITDGDNGILSASSSEEDYYRAMRRFLSMNVAEKEAMSQHGKETFSKYDISRTAQEYVEYYRQLME